jgi:AraC-like DNA-binding protein
MYYLPTTLYEELKIDKLYTIHYFEYCKNFTFAGEKHDFYEILYVDRGDVIASVNEKKSIVKQSQLVLYSPNEFHFISANNSVAPNTIIVSFSCESKCLSVLKNQIIYVNEYMRSLLAGIIKEGRVAYKNNLSDPEYKKLIKNKKGKPLTDAFAAEQVIKCYLQLLLIELLRADKNSLNKPSTLYKKSEITNKFSLICNYLDSHIDRKFKIDELCSQFMTNKQTLQKLFKSKTGCSVIEYFIKRKIEYAKKYLREGSLNISEISEKLGFSSIHYFTRVFKSVENMTPTEYLKSTKSIIDHSFYVVD